MDTPVTSHDLDGYCRIERMLTPRSERLVRAYVLADQEHLGVSGRSQRIETIAGDGDIAVSCAPVVFIKKFGPDASRITWVPALERELIFRKLVPKNQMPRCSSVNGGEHEWPQLLPLLIDCPRSSPPRVRVRARFGRDRDGGW